MSDAILARHLRGARTESHCLVEDPLFICITEPPPMPLTRPHCVVSQPVRLAKSNIRVPPSGPGLDRDRDRARRESDKTVTELRSKCDSLTAREQEVIGYVASGLMNKQIAGEISVSEITVRAHRGNLMQEMSAKSPAELVRMGDTLGVHRPKP